MHRSFPALFAWLFAVGAFAEEPPPADLAPYFTPPRELAADLGDYRSPLKFADGSAVKTPADWKKRREELLATWTKLLGERPAISPRPQWTALSEERRDGLTQRQLRIEQAPGRQTEDCYLLMPEGKGPFPAVVVVFYDAKTGVGLGAKSHRDFALQLAKRGFVALSLGSAPESYFPNKEHSQLQPLAYHALEATHARLILAQLPEVDSARIGVVGHSYGGKWSMFAAALDDQFAACATSDPGIVFDEKRSNVNYWERWYLGYEPGKERQPGMITEQNPRTGPYKAMREQGLDLHEIHALLAPRPFLVSGGAEDPPERWKALNHLRAVNQVLGFDHRAAMTNRKLHDPNEESNAVLVRFFEHFLAAKK